MVNNLKKDRGQRKKIYQKIGNQPLYLKYPMFQICLKYQKYHPIQSYHNQLNNNIENY